MVQILTNKLLLNQLHFPIKKIVSRDDLGRIGVGARGKRSMGMF